MPGWIVLSVWFFQSYCVPISVFLFLYWDSMYRIVHGAFWARVNELHCVHAFWQLILLAPCLENPFLWIFLGELDFLMKNLTYTLKIFASIFWFRLSLFNLLWLFCQQNLRNMLNYFRIIHKIPCKVHRKISASTAFIYADGSNSTFLYCSWSLSWFSPLHDDFYILLEKSPCSF